MTSTSAPPLARGAPPRSQPASGPATANVVVRPDLLTVAFALRTAVDDADAGIGLLRETVKAIEPRFAALAPPGTVRLRMRDAAVERGPTSYWKSSKEKKTGDRDPVLVTLRGAFEVSLAPSQDYWERAHEVARLEALSDRLAAASHDRSAVEAQFAGPTVGVRDPEAMRSEIIAKWGSRRQDILREAIAAHVPLRTESCRLSGDVSQAVLSIEEVELRFPIECQPAPDAH